MPRRLETGPLLVILGALLVLVALFLPWYTGELTAWDVFEVWDLVLAAFAVAAIAAAIGLLSPDVALVDRRWLPATVLAAVVVVAAEILDPPPAATGQDPRTGAWLALGGAVLMGGRDAADLQPGAARADRRGARPAPARPRGGRPWRRGHG